jgi:hypothetical protein
MTDKTIKTAYTVNGEGHILKFVRREDGSVWMIFRLADRTGDVLGSRAPMFRIDSKKPDDLEDARSMTQDTRLKLHSYEAEPKWVSTLVFHGKGPANIGTLRDFMDGSRVVFRYYPFTGGQKETAFDLNGAKAAIAAALDIPAEADAEAAAKQQERNVVLRAANNRCRETADPKTRVVCYRNNAECLKKAPEDNEALRRCLAVQ